jgi:antitoxin component of MazEF toxin-antitoxin module
MSVRIGRYKLRKIGSRGSAVTVPEVYLDDVQLKQSDDVDLSRIGRLLIISPVGVSVDSELASLRERTEI